MKKVLALLLVIALATPASAGFVEGEQVMYVGGTIPNLKGGCIGRLDATSAKELVFECAGERFDIPYAGIQRYEYSRKLARRIGAIPTVVVFLALKRRQRRHFVEIAFKDDEGTAQSMVLEVSKNMPQTVLAVLRARAPLVPYTTTAESWRYGRRSN